MDINFELKAGDVVVLKSKKDVKMTVEEVDIKKADCVWFEDNILCRDSFFLEELEKLETNKKCCSSCCSCRKRR